ncbi:hypothetical protein D3C72_2502000 [compost metagenome]
MLVAMVFRTIPMLSVSCSRKERCVSLKWPKEASSSTAFTSFSNSTGRTMMFSGAASPRPELMRT